MKYIYAALLLHSAGKDVSPANLTKVIKAAGDKPDPAQIKSLSAAVSEVDIKEVLKSSAALPTPTAPTLAEEAKPPEKEEKEEEEAVEEEAFEGLGGLFG
ncbi:MAG: 50S ribosomal protein L12 [Candidatus Geothermarchaeales archaeon]